METDEKTIQSTEEVGAVSMSPSTSLLDNFRCTFCGGSDFVPACTDGRGFCAACHSFGYKHELSNAEHEPRAVASRAPCTCSASSGDSR